MNYFFTSDTHFGHAAIIRYCHRPFENVEQMDQALIDNWNAVVGKHDYVFHLGDFSFARPERTVQIARSLHGVKHLLRGNHDRKIQTAFTRCFQWVKDYYELDVEDPQAPEGKQRIVLCHYAMRVWNKSHRGAWQLYGHSHGTLPEEEGLLAFDVGVDCHSYTPISYAKVKDKMQLKHHRPVDHHR